VYRNLGASEIEDQIAVTKHLVNNLAYIDANKTAIWGWSYGGYATAMTLGKDNENVFKCGIAVAPVTSWLYYDTIYTERYMGLPSDEDNWNNYNASSVMNHLNGIKSKQFMLIHGNADDNVHYQNSMMLARAMEQADVMFSQLSYPDENHSIAGPGMRRHLYHSIERFLTKECFGPVEIGVPSSSTVPNSSTVQNNSSTAIRFNSFYSIIVAISVILLTAYKK
jgi:dipeptidyl-peptidase-4